LISPVFSAPSKPMNVELGDLTPIRIVADDEVKLGYFIQWTVSTA